MSEKLKSKIVTLTSILLVIGLWAPARQIKQKEAESILKEMKKLESQIKSQIVSQREEGGFRAELTVHVTGPGDDYTLRYYFDNIHFFGPSIFGGSRFWTHTGRVVAAGTSTCDWEGKYHIFHAEANLSGEAVHSSTTLAPSFTLELWGDEEEDEVNYAFSSEIVGGYLSMQGYNYSIYKKSGRKSDTYPECDNIWPGSIKVGYPAVSNFERYATTVGGCVGYASGGAKAGISITDNGTYRADREEKCIQGTQTYNIKYTKPHILDTNYPTECPASVELTWRVYLEEVEIEVDKCTEGWRPEKDGDPVSVTARIVKPENATGKFRFTLYDQSNEPGYCMNAGEGDDVDLNFIEDPSTFDLPKLIEGNREVPEEVMETLEEEAEATVSIQPHDYGAFSKLKVEVNICGMWYTAHEVEGGKDYIDIPLDDDGNHIADHCPQNEGQASDDLDLEPEGDKTPGDGFTNYEEYRGFLFEDDEWHDTNIKIKDFFAKFDPSRLDFFSFPEISGLKCHRIRYTQMSDDRVVNFNHKTAHELDQHGVVVIEGLMDEEDPSSGETVSPGVWPAHPGSVKYVKVDPSRGRVEKTVPHELGHCVGIVHHGEEYEYLSKSANPELLWDELCPGKEVKPDHQYFCAKWEGLHSGHENCFMRYNEATFYKRYDGKVYFYGTAKEKLLLCTDSKGTGDNAPPERQVIFRAGPEYNWPQILPKCGDAIKGNCQGQIRVKDKK